MYAHLRDNQAIVFILEITMGSYPRMYFYKRIVMAKLYIDRHYGEPIDVENIASEACFSKFDFIRQFKKVYKKTP